MWSCECGKLLFSGPGSDSQRNRRGGGADEWAGADARGPGEPGAARRAARAVAARAAAPAAAEHSEPRGRRRPGRAHSRRRARHSRETSDRQLPAVRTGQRRARRPDGRVGAAAATAVGSFGTIPAAACARHSTLRICVSVSAAGVAVQPATAAAAQRL